MLLVYVKRNSKVQKRIHCKKYLTLSGISVNLFLSNLKFINLLRCPKFNGNDTN